MSKELLGDKRGGVMKKTCSSCAFFEFQDIEEHVVPLLSISIPERCCFCAANGSYQNWCPVNCLGIKDEQEM